MEAVRPPSYKEKLMAEKPKFKVPKTLAATADRMFELRTERSKIQKMADKLEEEEKFLKNYLIENLPKSDASGVAGKLCRVTAVTKPIAQVEDREKFEKYLLKTKDFSLLQGALSQPAIKERWEKGVKIPGVIQFNAVTLSVNKL